MTDNFIRAAASDGDTGPSDEVSPDSPTKTTRASPPTTTWTGHTPPEPAPESGPAQKPAPEPKSKPASKPAGPYSQELRDAGVPTELHDWLGAHGVGPLVVKMGIKFERLAPELTIGTMPVDGNTQVAGILHGGAHVVLAETLGSFAAGLWAGPGRHVVGIEVGATHHRAAASGTVTGTCTAIHLGGTVVTHEVVMTDEAGRRLSTARITNMIRENRD